MKILILPIWLSLSCFTAFSQVVSYPLNDTILVNGSVTYDFNNDAVSDMTFEIMTLSPGVYAARVLTNGNSKMLDNSTFGYPDTLNYGDPVTGFFHTGTGVLGTFNSAGQFNGAGSKYFGMKVDIAGNEHTGWVLVNCNDDRDTLRILSCGYSMAPSLTINAGDGGPGAVAEGTGAAPVKVFPNPSDGFLNIGSDYVRLKEIQVTDCYGRMVFRSECGGMNFGINLYTLVCGVYTLNILTTEGWVMKKWVKAES